MFVSFDLRPDARKLKQFGGIAFVALTLLGVSSWWRGSLLGSELGSGANRVALGLWIVGALCGLFALVWPQGNRPLYVVLTVLTFPVGLVLSHIVMVILFFGIFTPIGLLLRGLNRGPLQMAFREDRRSYWEDLPASSEKRDYFRQF